LQKGLLWPFVCENFFEAFVFVSMSRKKNILVLFIAYENKHFFLGTLFRRYWLISAVYELIIAAYTR